MDLKEEIYTLKEELNQLKEGFIEIYKILEKFKADLEYLRLSSTQKSKTDNLGVPAEIRGSSTHDYPFKALNTQNIGISIGNQGASTDRQTDRQTDQQTQNTLKLSKNQEKNTIDSAAEIIESLDNIKRQIRLKFKQLTNQEMLVFATIYQFDEEKDFITYRMLSEKLNLTESSIRDYVGRLLKKGIPIDKVKQNNKEIQLKISNNLRKIATLNTILKLREL